MLSAAQAKALALECGFDLAGIAPALPLPDIETYLAWISSGMAGEMAYLTDHRAERRADPRSLLPSARSVICVAKVYNGPEPRTAAFSPGERAWISRYAWGDDYHDLVRAGLRRLAAHLEARSPSLEYKVCVDTAPLLERSYARMAGIGWIGKNTCLIHPEKGSWIFLGELLVSLDLTPDSPLLDRCGTCTACIEACPTQALSPHWLDASRCISYLTIELRGEQPQALRTAVGTHVFGCDICQDVCPWNRRPAVATGGSFAARHFAPPLERLAAITEADFRRMFRGTPVSRAKYSGFLRNVAVALGNTRSPAFAPALERLSLHPHPLIASHAVWALEQVRTHRM